VRSQGEDGVKIKIEAQPAYGALDVGQDFAGYPIVQTVPGGNHMLVEVPDSWTEDEIDALVTDWLRRGLVVNDGHLWRTEHQDYLPLGFVSGQQVTGGAGTLSQLRDLRPAYTAGDTFGLMAIDEAIRQRGRYGAGVRVGLCDTGCAVHPWFEGKGWRGDLRDGHGHGTHCAGTIAGQQGVASDAVLEVRDVLPGGRGPEHLVAQGIRAVADAGCQVISLSLGGSPSGVIDDAVRYAQQRGCLVICAAGNGGGAAIGSPARASDLAVMAYDRNRQWATFTDGRNWQTPHRIGAPGVDIVSAAPGGGTRQMSGTSMACPHVAGAAALLVGAGLTPAQARDYLLGHRGMDPDGLAVALAGDFGQDSGEPAPPPEETNRIHELAVECIRVVDDARFHLRATDPDRAFDGLGSVSDYLTEITDLSRPKALRR
jgi:subtilisin family serine protease